MGCMIEFGQIEHYFFIQIYSIKTLINLMSFGQIIQLLPSKTSQINCGLYDVIVSNKSSLYQPKLVNNNMAIHDMIWSNKQCIIMKGHTINT
jgi:hypothetical protein